jgi:hypothetical protein
MAFVRLFASFPRILRIVAVLNNAYEFLFEALLIFCIAFLYWIQRKPPDKFFSFNAIVIEVRGYRHWIWRAIALTFLGVVSYFFTGATPPCKVWFNFFPEPPPQDQQSLSLEEALQEVMTLAPTRDLHAYTTLPPPSVACVTATDAFPRDLGTWDADDHPIVVDSATSRTITPFFNDLINPKPYSSNLKGIGQGKITHVGTVRWIVQDINGKPVVLEDPEAYYSKDAPYRLLCPHSWRESQNQRRYANGETEGDGATMSLDPNDNGGYILSWNRGKTIVQVPLDSTANLPMIQGQAFYPSFSAFAAAFPAQSTFPVDEDTTDVAPTTKRVRFADDANPFEPSISVDEPLTHRDEALFLSWHVKLGHAPFRNLRWAAELGLLPSRLKQCRNVVCPACLYGKQKRRPWRVKGTPKDAHRLKKSTSPGECVSVDQLISRTPGLVGQTTGRLTKARFTVATVFVDHYSDLDYVHVQGSTSAEDTIEAKRRFELFCQERGVRVRHYHADNGIFASRGFREEVQKCGQTLSFCGVGAHHQNGVAERRIQDLADSARSSLAYAAHRNPAVTANLWPYALRHASYVRRIMPREHHSKSPEELFTGSPVRPTTKFLHPFGCPVYVLHDALQSGNSIPKWDERSRVGIYLGHSAQHAQNVSLILNPNTGHISPQFHCVYDDNFDSAKTDGNLTTIWAEKAGLRPVTMVPESLPESTPRDYLQISIPPTLQVPFDASTDDDDDVNVVDETHQETPGNATDEDAADPRADNVPIIADPMPEAEGAHEGDAQEPVRTTRSGRRLRLTNRLRESPLLPRLQSFVSMVDNVVNVVTRLSDNSINELSHLAAFPASIADPDTMYLGQALKQPDRDEFLKAMIKEIDDHTSRGHWRITTRQEMRDKHYNHRPIAAIWSFKRKRNPFGDITKYKARRCCHGGQTIKGVHYDETFSPVVAWSTVRMLLTLSEVYGWHARQIDFVLAFPQADVKTDVFMQVPEKFVVDSNKKLVLDEHAPHPSKQDAVVKLIKNVYGLKDASKTWVDHLSKGLLDYGFIRSEVDPCLFVKGNLLFCLYVDDAICLTPNKDDADKLIADLERRGYILTDEGSLSAYLGIQVDRLEGNRISMKQPAFIERIIASCGLKDARMHDTPADVILHRDEDGQERKNEFHYRSVIGQLNYLAATTRPDIQFAVHQCARFCEQPKMSHEKAVKRIVRYLRRTMDKGLMMTVDRSKGVECYVDADFAGSFHKERPMNPRDCLSRTGFIVKYANCPIVWSSKLQTTIALSTTEAEYMALSSAAREVIFLMNLIDELRDRGVTLLDMKPLIHCRVFEDNAGAIELAKLPKLRPRTKHLAIQYHHFRSWTVKGLNGEEPRIKVEHIATTEQQADIMTKPLPRPQFQHLRQQLCGW